jgi:hypothetical protein
MNSFGIIFTRRPDTVRRLTGVVVAVAVDRR